MNLSFYIAKRYLFSKKKTNLINIISAISVMGLAIGTMGLTIGLSGFNGLDNLIKSLMSSFDPDLKITVVEGKYFSAETDVFSDIKSMSDVAYFAEIVEDNALLRNDDKEVLATIKGVSREFEMMTGLDTMIVAGEFKLHKEGINFAVFGQNVAYYLSIGLEMIDPVHIFVPRKGRSAAPTLEGSFNQGLIHPSGIFQVQQDLDEKYVIVPIQFARNLFEAKGLVTAIELKVKDGVDVDEVQKTIISKLGSQFVVKNRYQQHDYLYKTMQGEKFVTFLILILILVIASLNIIGSLTMLIIDKKDDIEILRSMGANNQLIRNIFLFEGWSISIIGSIIGTIAGVLICQAQIAYGFVKLQGGNSFAYLEAYPMKIISLDIVVILLSVMLLGFMASLFPVRYISTRQLKDESH